MSVKTIVIDPVTQTAVYDVADGDIGKYLESKLGPEYKYACCWNSGDTMYIPGSSDKGSFEVIGGNEPYKGLGVIVGREIGNETDGSVLVSNVAHTLGKLKMKFITGEAQ
jgi:hypothetical protein